MTTTLISDIRAAAYAKLGAIAEANPTAVMHVWPSRPASFSDLPCAYVGDFRASLLHTAGLRLWDDTQVSIVLVDSLQDNAETMERLATLADVIVNAFTDDPHALSEFSVSEPTGVVWTDISVGEIPYEAVVVTVGRFRYQEGR